MPLVIDKAVLTFFTSAKVDPLKEMDDIVKFQALQDGTANDIAFVYLAASSRERFAGRFALSVVAVRPRRRG